MSRFHGPQQGHKVQRPNGNNGPKGVLRAWKAERSKVQLQALEERRLTEAKLSAATKDKPHNWVRHPDGKLEIICATEECTAVWKPNKSRPPESKCPQAAKVSDSKKRSDKKHDRLLRKSKLERA